MSPTSSPVIRRNHTINTLRQRERDRFPTTFLSVWDYIKIKIYKVNQTMAMVMSTKDSRSLQIN